MATVIIAAHNEERVIGDCLDALLRPSDGAPLHVIVSANGCNDNTAQIAADRGADVVDRAAPGKAAALNAAEVRAERFPRIYLDADIVVPPGGVQQLIRVLDSAGVLAAVPRRRIDTRGRSMFVRGYFAINERLPVFRRGLFGRGMIAVSEAGRARFDEFPLLIADDLFLDSLFTDEEKAEVSTVEVIVAAPYRTKDLLNRLVRVRRGNAQMRQAAVDGGLDITVRGSDKWSWLRDVVRLEPRLALAAVPYVMITLAADLRARRPGRDGWGHDASTRTRQDPGRGE